MQESDGAIGLRVRSRIDLLAFLSKAAAKLIAVVVLSDPALLLAMARIIQHPFEDHT